MPRLPRLLVLFMSAAVWIGCGSKGGGGDPDAPVDGLACVPSGFDCTTDNECCSEYCEPTLALCAQTPDPTACGAPGEACVFGTDCCTLACVDSRCSANQCTADNEACTQDGECCGGSCRDNRCVPLTTACKSSGNPCDGHSQCCSKYCGDNGFCNPSPSFCTQTGDTCTTDGQCCGGQCEKAEGATYGLCRVAPASGATQCGTAGAVCGSGADYDGGPLPTCGGECCSRACFPYGPTGVLVCQPPSGCRPTGEVCRDDDDCCGSANQPDGERSGVRCQKSNPNNPFGRCDNGMACSPAGAICRLQSESCNANANCCAGNVLQFNTCVQDNLGIPRCTYAEHDCTNPEEYVGQECASSADCCGLPCVPNPQSGAEFPPLICGGMCVPSGGECTTTSDCCAGLPCNFPPGETTGVCGDTPTCSDYGQMCTPEVPCCNNVPCQDGICQNIVN